MSCYPGRPVHPITRVFEWGSPSPRMPVPLPSLLVAFGSASLGALFVSADAALSGLSSARIAALLEQDDRPFKSALGRYQSAPWKLRSTYIIGRSICAAVTAVMLA